MIEFKSLQKFVNASSLSCFNSRETCFKLRMNCSKLNLDRLTFKSAVSNFNTRGSADFNRKSSSTSNLIPLSINSFKIFKVSESIFSNCKLSTNSTSLKASSGLMEEGISLNFSIMGIFGKR